jgi:hypothetical protein
MMALTMPIGVEKLSVVTLAAAVVRQVPHPTTGIGMCCGCQQERLKP